MSAVIVLSLVGAVASILCAYFYGQKEFEKGRARGVERGISVGWNEGYFFKQNENKKHRAPNGQFNGT